MSGRVLIAHPEPAERARLAGVVRRSGFLPVDASRGPEALKLGADCVAALASPALPEMDGLRVLEELARRCEGGGPTTILLNDVYPVECPKERFLRDFGIDHALVSPAEPQAVAHLLARLPERPRRGRREAPRATRLTELPLLLLLARARRKLESAFLHVESSGTSAFLVLVRGDVALLGSNRPRRGDGGGDAERRFLAELLQWTEGEARYYLDPALEGSVAGRLDLLVPLDEATRSLSPALLLAAERNLARSARAVFEAAATLGELERALGLSYFERQVVELADGERSTSRIISLAQAGSIPLTGVLLRLEALGFLTRRRPGSGRPPAAERKRTPALTRGVPLLPSAPATRSQSSGRTDGAGLARLLVELEQCRASGTLSVRAGRTVEMAFQAGRLRGANSWGDGKPEEDPVHRLALAGELKPEDVPRLRGLHSQWLILEAMRAPELWWSFRAGEAQRIADTLGVNPAALVGELLRHGSSRMRRGPPPAAEQVDAVARAFSLGTGEARSLASWARNPQSPEAEPRGPDVWLRALGALLDPGAPAGWAALDTGRLLEAAPPVIGATQEDDLEQLFSRALDEGLRQADQAGTPRAAQLLSASAAAAQASTHPGSREATEAEEAKEAAPEPVAAAGAGPAAGAPVSPGPEGSAAARGGAHILSVDHGPDGLSVQLGNQRYSVMALIRQSEALRAETRRLESELGLKDGELDAARAAAHGLEGELAELRRALKAAQRTLADLRESRGEVDVTLAEYEAILPEKDRLIQEEAAALRSLQVDLLELKRRLGARESELAELSAVLPEKERLLADSLEALGQLREEHERLRAAGYDAERAMTELVRARDAERDRSEQGRRELEAHVARTQAAEQRTRQLEEQVEQLEGDLERLRTERDELTQSLTTRRDEAPRAKRGFLSDWRERLESRGAAPPAARDRALHEQRKAAEALRAESTRLARRVLDLEGEVERREVEIGRLKRDEERLGEQLERALDELQARRRGEEGERARRTELERRVPELLEAVSRETQRAQQQQRLAERLGNELAEMRDALASRETELKTTRSERDELQNHAERQGREAAGVQAELRREIEQTTARSQATERKLRHGLAEFSAELEAERGARAADQARAEQQLADAFSTHRAEIARLEHELLVERQGRATERLTLERAVEQEQAARAAERQQLETAWSAERQGRSADRARLERDLATQRQETTELRTRLEQERDDARARVALLEQRLTGLGIEADRLSGEHAVLKAEHARTQERLASERTAKAELAETLALRNARIRELESSLAEKSASLESRSAELSSLLDRLQIQKVTAEEQLRREVEQVRAQHLGELAAEQVRHQEELQALRAEMQAAEHTHQQRELQIQQRLEDLDGRLRDLQERRQALEATLGERNARLAELEQELGRLLEERQRMVRERQDSEEAAASQRQGLEQRIASLEETGARELQRASAARQELESRVKRLSEDEHREREQNGTLRAELLRLQGQLQGARERIAQEEARSRRLIGHVEEQRAELKERERSLEALSASVNKERSLRQRLEAEAQSRAGEIDRLKKTHAQGLRDVGQARQRLLELSEQGRELSELLAEQEELINNLKAKLTTADRERARVAGELELREAHRKREIQQLSRVLSEMRLELNRAREAARGAQARERDLRNALAVREPAGTPAPAARPGAATSQEPNLRTTLQALKLRVAELEQAAATHVEAQSVMRAEINRLQSEATDARQASSEAQIRAELYRRDAEIQKQTDVGNDDRVRDLQARLAELEKSHARQLLAARDEAASLRKQVHELEFSLTERDDALALLDATLTANEELVAELERRLAKERSRAQEAESFGSALASKEAQLKLAVDRARQELTAAERERDTLRARLGIEAAGPSPARAPRDTETDLDRLIAERQSLLATSRALSQGISRLRDTLERKAHEVATLQSSLGSPDTTAQERPGLERRRQDCEEELHRLQSELGTQTVRVSEVNARIVERNRHIQRLLEEGHTPKRAANLERTQEDTEVTEQRPERHNRGRAPGSGPR